MKIKISTNRLTLAFTLLLVSVLFGCTSSNDFSNGKKQLEQQGYTNVKNTGYNFFCCGKKETFSTGFECKDKNGNTVKGCFCSDFWKGLTIRFDQSVMFAANVLRICEVRIV